MQFTSSGQGVPPPPSHTITSRAAFKPTMRLLRHILAASAAFLWENVQSAPKIANHTNSTALNLLTLPPRLDITASVAPSLLGPQVVASDETELENQDSEEKVRPPLQSLSLLTEWKLRTCLGTLNTYKSTSSTWVMGLRRSFKQSRFMQ